MKIKTINDVNKYAKHFIKLLNLSHWSIEFIDTNTEMEDGLVALNNLKCEYKRSIIDIYNNFYLCDEDYKKIIIIHELLHCHLSFWRPIFNNHFEGFEDISRVTELRAYKSFSTAEEEPTELLARSIYNLYKKSKK